MNTAERIHAVQAAILGATLRTSKEALLQDDIGHALRSLGVQHRREVSIGDAGRLDFMVGEAGKPGIAVEAKIKGSRSRNEGLMVRRTRADVGRELPPLHLVPVVIDADVDHINRASKEVADLARLILDDTSAPLERGRAAREVDWKMRQATGIAKAPFVAAFVQMLLEDGASKVLLYGWHREVYSIWMDLLDGFDPIMYTGSESPAAKRRAAETFKSGEARVLVMSLRSGAGLDGLQGCGCHDVVFGEFDWSPQVHHQGAGRVHRDGIPESVTAWFPWCESGTDPAIMEVLGIKKAQSEGILNPDGAEIGPRIDTERMRRLAERVLGR